ncbi:MAG TPA: HAD family phosphatase [Anaerolineales bacterium]|nr:HAD family phosphatase [Anaerolineales bacterium]
MNTPQSEKPRGIRLNNPYPAIVFDFGGVILDWNPRYLYRKFFDGDLNAMENFLNEIDFTGWNLEQDKGRPFAVGVAELSEQFPQYADLIRAYDQHWEEAIAGPIQPTVNLLESLKRTGYALYGLSNWSAEKFQIARPRYEFLSWFETIMVSGEVELVKPDPRIYRLFLERIGRTAEECLFIDDSEPNVVAADQLGFKAIRFESPGQLETELKFLGLLP